VLGQRARFTKIIVIVRFTDLIFLLLCVARGSAPFGSSVPFRHPPVAALHTLYKSNCYLYPITLIQVSGYFFFFRIGGCASKIYISLHGGQSIPPGQIATSQPGLLPGGENR